MEKIKVNNISASAIIFPKADPSMFFAEVKDNGYPVTVFRNCLCCIGGNWIGEKAKTDAGPRATFLREFMEEFSFDRPTQSTLELVDLGQARHAQGYSTMPCSKEPTAADRGKLDFIKAAVEEHAKHFVDNIQRVPKDVFDKADPNNKRESVSTLNSFFIVPLPNEEWSVLRELQIAFGNLSNESLSLITTLDAMVNTKQSCSWGYDRILQSFFLGKLYIKAKYMSLFPGVEVEFLCERLNSYEEYLDRFEVAKHPLM